MHGLNGGAGHEPGLRADQDQRPPMSSPTLPLPGRVLVLSRSAQAMASAVEGRSSTEKPAMSSFDSVKGPSIHRRRVPAALEPGLSAALAPATLSAALSATVPVDGSRAPRALGAR